MTDLRDPRLHRVLDAAPDDGLRPAAQTRDAIRTQALAAVAQPSAPVRWWRQAWALAAGSGRPWNAAFATLLVAGFVTVLWQGREVPPVAEPPPGADVAAPAAAPAATTARVPAPAPAPAPVAENATAPERATTPTPAPALGQRAAQKAKPQKEAVADAPAPPVVAERMAPMAQASAEAAPAARDRSVQDAGTLAAGAAAASPPVARMVAPAPAPAPAAAAPAPSAPPAPAPAVRAAAPAAAKSVAVPSPSPAWSGWSHLRIVLPDRVLTLGRAQVPALAALLDSVPAAQPPGAAPWSGALWRLELERQSEVQGVLEVARDALRWTPAASAGPTQTVVPDPARQQALLDELARLAARQ